MSSKNKRPAFNSFSALKREHQELKASLKCPLCLDTLQKPVKTLPCLHSFCSHCLDQHVASDESSSSSSPSFSASSSKLPDETVGQKRDRENQETEATLPPEKRQKAQPLDHPCPVCRRKFTTSTGGENKHEIRENQLANSLLNRLSSISSLLDYDPARSPTPPSSQTTLHSATTAVQVMELLGKGEDIEKIDSRFRTPLVSACKRGNLEVVDCLLNHGANPNNASPRGMKPMHMAACSGHVLIVERLLKAGVDINDKDDGGTPLAIASAYGQVQVVDRLLDLGADPEEKSSVTPLVMAITNDIGHLAIVDRLLQAGANPNHCSNFGRTSPLILAAQWGHVDIVERLVGHGADLNHIDDDEASALIWACLNGHLDVVDRLLSLKCDVNARDSAGRTALMKACQKKSRAEVVKLLLDQGADPLITNIEGKKAFDHADSIEIRALLQARETMKDISC